MSDYGDVPTAILSAVDGAVTLGGTNDGFIPYAKIPADKFPYAMIFDPVKQQDRGDFQHGVETTQNPLIVVYHNTALSDVNDDIVSIEAALNGSTLSGIVEDTWVSVVGRDEGVDSAFTAAVFQVDTRASV